MTGNARPAVESAENPSDRTLQRAGYHRMTNRVPLNNVDHPDLRVIAGHRAEFGDSVNQVLVFPTEFEEIQREYPIFFRREESGALQAVALLGLDRDENLFLGENGWEGRYVPAILQRGPFLIGFKDGGTEGEPMIHIDQHHPRVSRTEGLPLFLPHGGNTPYLEHIAGILRTIYTGIEANQPMFEALDQAGLIEPVAVEIELDEARKYVLPDLFTIARGALAQLDGSRLERLNTSGFLPLAFLVIASMGNMGRLIDLKNRKAKAA
ncbi:MAG: SapC family protein [Candidatus Sphingomonas phytovorans]|nr:SapC family protein [Sphingomonas sp.]WEK00779.1 MAG: SapC family protein [Sphingomonas sp.]